MSQAKTIKLELSNGPCRVTGPNVLRKFKPDTELHDTHTQEVEFPPVLKTYTV